MLSRSPLQGFFSYLKKLPSRHMSFGCLPESGEPMILDDYIKAIKAGDMTQVNHWFKDRLFFCPAIEEAALDLASRQTDPRLAQLIQERLAQDRSRNRAMSNKMEQRGPYRYIRLTFDRAYYFYYLSFASHPEGFLHLQTGYRTQLEAPFVQHTLQPLAGNVYSDRTWFKFCLSTNSEEDIRQQVKQIIIALIQLKKKDGSEIDPAIMQPILDALETAFIDARKGFPPHDEPLVSDWEHYPSSYDSYELYEAAAHADCDRMQELLCRGINPNTRFNHQTPLRTAAGSGTDFVFNRFSPGIQEVRYENHLRTIKLLLEYGADPGLMNYGETLMEFLVRHSQYLKPAQQAVYQEIIALLTTHKNAQKHIQVHPDVASSSIASRVLEANHEMDKKTRSRPCVTSVIATDAKPALVMFDGSLLEFESANIADLTAADLDSLFDYFNAQPSVLIQSDQGGKRAYFDALMHTQEGVGYVDMVRHNGQLKGYVISAMIPTVIAGQDTVLYWGKVVIATLPASYAGIMKAVVWLRGFARSQCDPNRQHIYFYEAASARGFGITDTLKRFPALPVLKENMSEIMEKIYTGMNPEIKMHRGAWFIRDAFEVNEPIEKTSQRWPTFAAVARENWQAIYKQHGWVMAVAYPNDQENYARCEEALIPLIGAEAFNTLLTFYRDQPCDLVHDSAYSNRVIMR